MKNSVRQALKQPIAKKGAAPSAASTASALLGEASELAAGREEVLEEPQHESVAENLMATHALESVNEVLHRIDELHEAREETLVRGLPQGETGADLGQIRSRLDDAQGDLARAVEARMDQPSTAATQSQPQIQAARRSPSVGAAKKVGGLRRVRSRR